VSSSSVAAVRRRPAASPAARPRALVALAVAALLLTGVVTEAGLKDKYSAKTK